MSSFRTLLRIMWTEKRNHILNLSGLSIGLCIVIFISIYIRSEVIFDKHIVNYTNKYRLLKQFNENREAIFPYIAGEVIREQVPELESFCIVDRNSGQVSIDNNAFKLGHILVSDSTFIDMFDVQLLQGGNHGLLNAPNTCIISESTAKRFFGNNNPIGESIKFSNQYDRTVTAVFQDFPETTHLKANAVVSRSSWHSISWKKRYFNSWGNQGSNFYVTLLPKADQKQIREKLRRSILENATWFGNMSEEERNKLPFQVNLQSLEDIHLFSSDVQWDSSIVKNDISTIKSFVMIMALVLLLACFNYVNLNTANAGTKNRIAGIQKMHGAKRKDILFFFLKQTFVIGLVAVVTAFFLSCCLLPLFNNLVKGHLDFALLLDPILWGSLLGIIFLSLLFSGFYPALYFSSGSPLLVITNAKNITGSGLKVNPRYVLVTLQFMISIFLIISLFSIREQILLLTKEKLGFEEKQLLEVRHYRDKSSYDFLAGEFKKLASVEDVSAASNMPCEYINNQNALFVVGKDNPNPPSGCLVGIEPNYLDVMNTSLLEGKGFEEELETDANNVLINQTTVRKLGLSDPIGKQLKLMGRNFTVIGIVEDVQYRTLHEPALPVLYTPNYNNYRKIAIKLKPGNHIEAVNQIKSVWSERYPNTIIDLRFFDDKLNANYSNEVKHLHLLNILVVLGIFIMILGLLGLIWYTTEQRTKEIGIRKANGAKIYEILAMLNTDFVKWVVIAFIIATPVAYYAMSKWLQNFAYKTELSWWIFALAGVIALGIALLTVSWQSWRAARRNPVEALRYE